MKDCRITPSILQYLPQGRCRAELTVDASLFAEETQLQELSILDRAGRTVLTQNVLFQNGRLHACLTLENRLAVGAGVPESLHARVPLREQPV